MVHSADVSASSRSTPRTPWRWLIGWHWNSDTYQRRFIILKKVEWTLRTIHKNWETAWPKVCLMDWCIKSPKLLAWWKLLHWSADYQRVLDFFQVYDSPRDLQLRWYMIYWQLLWEHFLSSPHAVIDTLHDSDVRPPRLALKVEKKNTSHAQKMGVTTSCWPWDSPWL